MPWRASPSTKRSHECAESSRIQNTCAKRRLVTEDSIISQKAAYSLEVQSDASSDAEDGEYVYAFDMDKPFIRCSLGAVNRGATNRTLKNAKCLESLVSAIRNHLQTIQGISDDDTNLELSDLVNLIDFSKWPKQNRDLLVLPKIFRNAVCHHTKNQSVSLESDFEAISRMAGCVQFLYTMSSQPICLKKYQGLRFEIELISSCLYMKSKLQKKCVCPFSLMFEFIQISNLTLFLTE